LDIIISRDERSLRSYVLNRACACIEKQENTILLVPSQMTFLMEKRLLALTPAHAFYSLEVLSFEKLTDRILESAGGAARPTYSQTGAYMLAKDALMALRGQTVFDDRRDRTLHRKLADTVGSLKMEAIRPEDLDTFSETAPPLLKDKLCGISAVYKHMLASAPDAMDRADAEALARSRAKDAEFLRGATLIVHGFDYLPIRRREMLAALFDAVGDVAVTFEADPQDELFSITNGNLIDIEAIARRCGRTPKRTVLADAPLKDGIRRAAEDIFSFGKCKTAPTGDVYVYKAKDKRAEAENAARIALDLCTNKGLRARDIAVFAATVSDYAAYLGDAFTKAGLPYYIDGKRPLITAPAAASLITALSLAGSDKWRIADAMTLVKSGMTALTDDEAEALACYARSRGLYGSAMKSGIKKDADMEELRLRAFAPVIELGKGEGTLLSRITNYLEASMAREKERSISEEMAALGRAGDARFHDQVVDRMLEIVRTSAEIFPNIEITEMRDLLTTAFEDASIAIVPPLTDQITVTEILHAVPADIKVAIVLGVNEGVLPVPSSMGGIITEEENTLLRRELASFPAGLSLTDQKCRLRRAFSSADTLIFSYNDGDGPPSRIVRRALQIFATQPLPAITRINTPSGGMGHLSRELRALKSGAEDTPKLLPMYMAHAPEQAARMLSALSNDGSAKPIGDIAPELYGAKRASVSQLQDFHSCAFKNFVNRGLSPKEIEELSERPAEAGTYAHALLDGLFRTLKSRGKSWRDATDEDIASIIDEQAAECMEEHNLGIFLTAKRHKYTESVIRREINFAAQAVRDQLNDGSADVFATEKRFDGITVTNDKDAIRLRGVIDRIDIAHGDEGDLMRIVDYKTGVKQFHLNEFFMGTNIQLVIYMIAAMTVLKNEGLDAFPAGGFYFRVAMPYADAAENRYKQFTMHGLMLADADTVEQFDTVEKGKLKNHSVRISENSTQGAYTREELAVMMDYAARITEDAARRIYSGEIDIHPCVTGSALACTYCDYISICRFRKDSGAKRYAPRTDKDGLIALMKGDENA